LLDDSTVPGDALAPPLALGALALDALPAHVAVLDRDGVVRLTNAAWDRFAERNGSTDPARGRGRSYLAVCEAAAAATDDADSADARAVAQGLRAVLAGRRERFSFACYPCHAPSGAQRWFALEAQRLPDGGAVVMHTDVSAMYREAQLARSKALHDPLTGLANRALFRDRLAQALGRAQRDRTLAALLLIDLDGFKAVNDTHGHAAGDAVLLALARRMVARRRAVDTVARLGGDEFAVVLAGVRDRADAARLAAETLATCQHPVPFEGHLLHPRLSVGMALYPQDGAGERDLLRRADRAMYDAKARGGGRVEPASGAARAA
jgi:diguanylate cyclase (GGDEF)-like protein